MPLPAGVNQPWPPKEYQPAFSSMNAWSAWYMGDQDQLAAVYSNATAYGQMSERGFEPRRGGLLGRTLARWFWGRSPSPGEPRAKLHIPIAADIATTSADLLFSDPVGLTLENTKTQDRLETLRDTGAFDATLLEAAEVQSPLGGVYLRVCWDLDVADGPFLNAVHADSAVPEFAYNQLRAVTFWNVIAQDGTKVWRHLERHEPGAILHGLYQGDANTLGRMVPLAEMPATAGIAGTLADDPNRIDAIKGKLTAVYIPNIRPNRRWRTNVTCAPLGRSDYDGAEGAMDALDEVYTSWMRDVRLAKGRLVVPQEYMQNQGKGKGASFDPEREVFTTLPMLPQPGGPPQITISQFAIRVDEHQRTCQDLIGHIIRSAGYSGQTFGEVGDVAMTATEATARERRSYQTRRKKVRYWNAAIADIIEVLLAVDAQVFHTKGVTPERPDVDFPEPAQDAPLTLAQTVQALAAAEAVSLETKVTMVHPDWDADQIKAEVKAIQDENAPPVTDPSTFGADMPADGGDQYGDYPPDDSSYDDTGDQPA